jgi:hypothetical protein
MRWENLHMLTYMYVFFHIVFRTVTTNSFSLNHHRNYISFQNHMRSRCTEILNWKFQFSFYGELKFPSYMCDSAHEFFILLLACSFYDFRCLELFIFSLPNVFNSQPITQWWSKEKDNRKKIRVTFWQSPLTALITSVKILQCWAWPSIKASM